MSYRLALVILCLTANPAWARTPDADPCTGIRMGYHESISAQGFFGALTPRSSAEVVKAALNRNLEWVKSATNGRHDFNWPYVCKLARAKGLSVLWIGCHGDTDEESSEYYGSYVPRRSLVGLVKAECVVSYYSKSRHPSWGDLTDTAFLRKSADQITLVDGDKQNRHDELAKREVRIGLYMQVLRLTVESPDYDGHKSCQKLTRENYLKGLSKDEYPQLDECNPDL